MGEHRQTDDFYLWGCLEVGMEMGRKSLQKNIFLGSISSNNKNVESLWSQKIKVTGQVDEARM